MVYQAEKIMLALSMRQDCTPIGSGFGLLIRAHDSHEVYYDEPLQRLRWLSGSRGEVTITFGSLDSTHELN